MTVSPDSRPSARPEPSPASSRIPRSFRQSADLLLSFLQRTFDLQNEEVLDLRNGTALRLEHAVNMVENAIGVLGLPLGLGLNFVVNEREYIVPMAIEEASIIAAASKAALMVRRAGGFTASADEPVMIGQIQVLDVPDPEGAEARLREGRDEVLASANAPIRRMVSRGGGAFDLDVRRLPEGEGESMLVVHLKIDVREAMGANAVNYACEAAGPVVEKLTGGRVNLRIVSNYATYRLARARFGLPVDKLADADFPGEEVARRMVEASRFAEIDPYRAATHNKGIFNGICAAAVALGQDWRAIEAGGHAHAARDGRYRGLTSYRVEEGRLVGKIELPLQVGWVGGAVNSHPGIRLLRRISGVKDARELACVLAAVGLAQNFAACLALSTVGIQQGHMALHARSVAMSVGIPASDIETVAREMIRRGEVSISGAEKAYHRLTVRRRREERARKGPVEAYAPGKVVLFGEHATVYGFPGITAAIDLGLKVRIRHDPDGPNYPHPYLRRAFPADPGKLDFTLFGKAVETALAMYGLENAPLAIEVESDLVPGMGLGTSAALSTALCTALRRYRKMSGERCWDRELFEEVQKLEAIFHGTPSGMDAATVLSGNVLWFRAGPPREVLPLKLRKPVAGVVCLVEPGASTRELVARVRRLREAHPERIDRLLGEIGEITTQAGIALGSGHLAETGRLMVKNHERLRELGVSTPGLDRAVEFLLENGALGAKLTGAGGGGAVVALVRPELLDGVLERLTPRFPSVFTFGIGG